jgi:hypothetical protein
MVEYAGGYIAEIHAVAARWITRKIALVELIADLL